MTIFVCCAICELGWLKCRSSFQKPNPGGVILLLFLIMIGVTDAQFLVDVIEKTYGGWRLVHRCEARGANFGVDVPSFSYMSNVTGCVSFTTPRNACDAVQEPLNITGCSDFYAFVPRGNCTFSVKAYRVQLANYEALIVYSNPGDQPTAMDGSTYKDLIKIPVVMVSYACMDRIMESYRPEDGYKVAIRAIPGYYNLVKYLIPFVCVVAICFIVLFFSLLFRVFRERRRSARKRLSKRNLKKLPTKKFKKGDSVETCAICLDDFIDGEKLRILPCNHVYHCKCIDPWLTKNRKVCPICKGKIRFPGDSDTSDSDAERNTAAGTSGSNVREDAPLIENEVPFVAGSSNQPQYLDAGRNFTESASNNIVDFNVDEPTTSGVMSSTPVDSYAESDVDPNGYLDNVISEPVVVNNGRNLSGVSTVIREKFRPFVQNLVSKASKVARKDRKLLPEVSKLDAGGLESTEEFSAENEAFEDSSENRDFKDERVFTVGQSGDTGSICTSSTLVAEGTEFNDESIYFSANDQSLPLEQANDDGTEKTLTENSSDASFTAESDRSFGGHP